MNAAQTPVAPSRGDGDGARLATSTAVEGTLEPPARPAFPVGVPAAPTVIDPMRELRVIVIDDRLDRRQLMRHVIELSNGDTKVVGFASSPTSAVETVDRLEANAVVIEIQLPVDQGLATIDALRAGHPDLRIVVCSFHTDRATKDAALARGADAYLAKPFSPRALWPLLQPSAPSRPDRPSSGAPLEDADPREVSGTDV